MTDRETRDVGESASKFLQGILERMDIEADIEISEEDDKIILDISCSDVERLIGRRGQVIDALQHMVSKGVYRERSGPRGKAIVLDADGYRQKHIERLETLAERMATKAIKTQSIVELSPMTAHDRRIVHMALADMEGVSTRSEGEGEDRHVLVVPESAGESGTSAAAE